VIVAAHATTGLADACAPSRYETVDDYLVLAYVAHGYAVIATDYAGLGNEGTQGYSDNKDTGQSTLDAARALRKLVASGLSNKTIVAGHSQGGGAALSAQALARSYGDGDVVGVIGFAPGWEVKVDVSGYAATSISTSIGAGLPAALASLHVDAYFANRVGATHEGDGFGASARSAVVGDIGSQCIVQLAQSIPQAAATFGDLFDATFRQSVLDCAGGGTCVEPGKSYVAFLQSNILSGDRNGGHVLVVQGLSDTTVTPASTKCVVDKLTADGVTPQVCTDMNATHLDVTQRNAKLALDWIDALVDGTAPPSCDGSGLPTCQ
jgi:pimeloyl-ACP methyl ester carboxylesterase